MPTRDVHSITELGQRLRTLRGKKTQTALADDVGTSQAAISRAERGDPKYLGTLRAALAHFGVTFSDVPFFILEEESEGD